MTTNNISRLREKESLEQPTETLHRRKVIIAIGGGTAFVLAGCVGNDDDDEPDDEPVDDEPDDADDEPDDEPVDDEPDDADDEPDDEPVDDEPDDADDEPDDDADDEPDDDADDEPDDDADDEPDDDADDELDSEYVDEVDEQVVLSYGETALLSNGTQITAHEFEFDTSLGQFSEADEGMHFALLYLTGENTGDSAERLPTPWFDFSVLYNSSQADAEPGIGMDDYEEFEGGEVQPGVTREGYVVFEVPEDLGQADLDTIWFDDFLDRSIDVRWTNE